MFVGPGTHEIQCAAQHDEREDDQEHSSTTDLLPHSEDRLRWVLVESAMPRQRSQASTDENRPEVRAMLTRRKATYRSRSYTLPPRAPSRGRGPSR